MEERREKENRRQKEIVIDVDKVFMGLCVGLTTLSVGISLYSVAKLNSFSKKLGISLNELKHKTHVEITDDLVNKYTNRAVQVEASKAAKVVSEELRADMHDILSRQVSEAVSNQYDNVKEEVSRELRKKVNSISISALRSEIKDEATRSITDKLATQMDDIIAVQTDRLENMAKAYKDMGEFIKNKA